MEEANPNNQRSWNLLIGIIEEVQNSIQRVDEKTDDRFEKCDIEIKQILLEIRGINSRLGVVEELRRAQLRWVALIVAGISGFMGLIIYIVEKVIK